MPLPCRHLTLMDCAGDGTALGLCPSLCTQGCLHMCPSLQGAEGLSSGLSGPQNPLCYSSALVPMPASENPFLLPAPSGGRSAVTCHCPEGAGHERRGQRRSVPQSISVASAGRVFVCTCPEPA